MTPADAVAAAERAANATCRSGPKDGGFLGLLGCGGRIAMAAEFVRANPDAAAEAVFLTVRRDRALAWRDLEARKRAAVEVFRATLLICDRLVPPAPAVVQRPAADSYLLDSDCGELIPDMAEQERLR